MTKQRRDIRESYDVFFYLRLLIQGKEWRAEAVAKKVDPFVMRNTLTTLLLHILSNSFEAKAEQLDWLDHINASIQAAELDMPPRGAGREPA